MENEMIERVGDALLKAFQAISAGQTAYLHSRFDDDGNPVPDDLSAVMIDGIWDFRAVARAALVAMRKPTKQMAVQAAKHAADFVGYAGDNGEDLAIEMWCEMIDAAISAPA